MPAQKPRQPAAKALRPAAQKSAGPGTIKRSDYVSAFVRGLDVLRLFDAATPRLSVSVAAERTGLSRAAARRFLLTLHEIGYVSMAGDLFELRPSVLELGYAYLSTWSTAELVTPFLRAGVEAMKENVSFGVLDGDQAVYVARAEAGRLVHSVVIHVGVRVPAVVSAMGRTLLAFQPPDVVDQVLAAPLPRMTANSIAKPAQLRKVLAEVKEKRWCLVSEEFEIGLMSIAVPITGENDRVVAAINVGVSTTRASPADMVERFLPGLQLVGARISGALKAAGRS